MTAMPPPMTPEAFLALRDEGDNFELIDGRLKERNVSKESSWVGGCVFLALGNHCVAHGGWFFPSDLGYACFPDSNRVRKADASFVSLAAMPVETYTDEGFCSTPPDLVAEVVSPNDLSRDVDGKVQEWFSAGVKVVWVIQPDHKTVRIHRADGTFGFLRETDTLTEPGVLPGFAVPVADLFRRPTRPSA